MGKLADGPVRLTLGKIHLGIVRHPVEESPDKGILRAEELPVEFDGQDPTIAHILEGIVVLFWTELHGKIAATRGMEFPCPLFRRHLRNLPEGVPLLFEIPDLSGIAEHPGIHGVLQILLISPLVGELAGRIHGDAGHDGPDEARAAGGILRQLHLPTLDAACRDLETGIPLVVFHRPLGGKVQPAVRIQYPVHHVLLNSLFGRGLINRRGGHCAPLSPPPLSDKLEFFRGEYRHQSSTPMIAL